MPTTIDRLKVFFLVVFAVSCVITWTYHFMYIWPRNQCEDKGDWWDAHDRVCAVPMPISQFTGRALKANPQAPAASSAPKAASVPLASSTKAR